MTLVVNLLDAALSFGSTMFVARSLGVADYGNLQFLTATALSIRQFFDLGSSSAFFTLLSRGDRRPRVFGTYFGWLLIQLGLILLAAGALLPVPWTGRMWLGQPKLHVAFAIASAFAMDMLWGTVINVGESIRRTDIVQLSGLAAIAVYCLALVGLRLAGMLSVSSVLVLNVVTFGALSVVIFARLWRMMPLHSSSERPEGNLVAYYRSFCEPSMWWALPAFIGSFADTWMLQHFAGAKGQGIYRVSQQLSVIALLATSSFVKVFWKEIAEAVGAGNLERAHRLYDKAARLLYLFGAVVAAFFIPLSSELVKLSLGPAYAGAAVPVAIMLLYPIHQSLGQLNGTFFNATAQLKAYYWASVPAQILSPIMTYFALASPAARIPGLGLGDVGLPIKQVVLQVVSVNILSWVIHRRYGWRLNWTNQLWPLAVALACAYAVVAPLRDLFGLAGFWHPIIPLFIGAAALYGVCLLAALRFAPGVLGVRRDEASEAIELARSLWVRTLAFAGAA